MTYLPPSLKGSTLGKFVVGKTLGRGGMGTVFRATTRMRGNAELTVAIKVMLGGGPHATRSFHEEMKLLARLKHGNVCKIIDSGEDSERGLLWYAMEFIEGQDLRRLVEDRPMPVAQALWVTMRVLGGIESLHEQGVVHCDLKPDNILIGDLGDIKITDFGIGKDVALKDATNPWSELRGTPCYMSPEQWEGRPRPQSDLFAVGAILGELLCRKPLFPSHARFQEIGSANLDWTLPPIPAPRELDEVLRRACARNLDGRYATARDFQNALERVAARIDGANSEGCWKDYVVGRSPPTLRILEPPVRPWPELEVPAPVFVRAPTLPWPPSEAMAAAAAADAVPVAPAPSSSAATKPAARPFRRRSASTRGLRLAVGGGILVVLLAIFLATGSPGPPAKAETGTRGTPSPPAATTPAPAEAEGPAASAVAPA